MAVTSFVNCIHCGKGIAVAGPTYKLKFWLSENKCPHCGYIQNAGDDPEEVLA